MLLWREIRFCNHNSGEEAFEVALWIFFDGQVSLKVAHLAVVALLQPLFIGLNGGWIFQWRKAIMIETGGLNKGRETFD